MIALMISTACSANARFMLDQFNSTYADFNKITSSNLPKSHTLILRVAPAGFEYLCNTIEDSLQSAKANINQTCPSYKYHLASYNYKHLPVECYSSTSGSPHEWVKIAQRVSC